MNNYPSLPGTNGAGFPDSMGARFSKLQFQNLVQVFLNATEVQMLSIIGKTARVDAFIYHNLCGWRPPLEVRSQLTL